MRKVAGSHPTTWQAVLSYVLSEFLQFRHIQLAPSRGSKLNNKQHSESRCAANSMQVLCAAVRTAGLQSTYIFTHVGPLPQGLRRQQGSFKRPRGRSAARNSIVLGSTLNGVRITDFWITEGWWHGMMHVACLKYKLKKAVIFNTDWNGTFWHIKYGRR